MESPHFNTSHRSETTGIAERAVRRLKRRHFSSIATIRTGWKVVVRFFGMLLLSAKHPRFSGRWENTVWKTIWRIIQRTIIPFGALIESHPIPTKDQTRIHQFGKKTDQESFLALRWSRAEFGKGIFWWKTWKWKIWKSSTHLIFVLEESTRKRSWSDKKRWWIHILICRWYRKTVRDNEFREPTLRREKTLRIEDLSGGLRDEPGEESQPTETTDDAEARADFWSIQGDFIYRHHNEPRVQLYVPKEETFPIQLKYINVTWSTHTELDVLQEKRIDDYKNDDSGRYLSDSWRGFNLQKDWQRFKQLPDQIMKGQKFGRKVVKPVRIERYKNGQKKNRSSTMLENERNLLYWSRGRRIQRNSQEC